MPEDARHKVIRSGELVASPKGTMTFEGKDFGSGVSLFLIDYWQQGEGPGLHKHPYPETWIIRAGNARFTVDGQEIEAGSGDILVVASETPHRFRNMGPGNLDIICIHPSPTFIQEDLE